jgi:hypothetical protein
MLSWKEKRSASCGEVTITSLGTSNFEQNCGIPEKKYHRTTENKFSYPEGPKF